MIVATAGHVDHGKTSLVKALTGVDTDRLKEEKARGMSIDLGFAYADFDGGQRIGFVDVPGHERFLRNMLAGVAAVDFAVLAVAADDGPMPQTIEHLAILDLLGIRRGAVALTKTDRVSASRVSEASEEIRKLLSDGVMADAPIFPVVATSGEGVPALRDYLRDVSGNMAARPSRGNFRLAVDRSFIVPGAGLVVAGAVLAGTARVGDQLMLSPQGIAVRVRGIHAQNRPADAARTGQRCALNIVGSELTPDMAARGDWLVAPDAHAPTARFDGRIKVLASEPRPLAHWTPVHLHIGAAVRTARVAGLSDRAIAPGQEGLVQLVLDAPVAALHGDRFVLRDQSAQRTIAGGIVLDPFGPVRGRAKPARLTELAAMDMPLASDVLSDLLTLQQDGVDLGNFALARNLVSGEMDALLRTLSIYTVSDRKSLLGFSASRWQSMCDDVLRVLSDWHRQQPESRGPTDAELAAAMHAAPRAPLLQAAIAALIETGRVRRAGFCLCLHEHVARLTDHDAALLERVTRILQENGLRPPIVGELTRMLDMEQPALVEFLERASVLGHLVRVARNRYFLPVTVETLIHIARQLASESPQESFDAATYRDRTGIGRNLTIEVLEYLDRAHVTRFLGGRRRLV